jgi:hypothetical protein
MSTIEQLRQFRIFNYAIFDFAVSFLGIWLIAPFLSKFFRRLNLEVPKSSWLFLTLPISILVHILAKNITPMTENFLDLGGHYILKTIVLGSMVFGLKGIKIIKKQSK